MIAEVEITLKAANFYGRVERVENGRWEVSCEDTKNGTQHHFDCNDFQAMAIVSLFTWPETEFETRLYEITKTALRLSQHRPIP